MAKQVRQFRYYAEGSKKNYPDAGKDKVNLQSLINGTPFGNYVPIVQLGIQTIPGTKFFLNSGQTPIIVGNTGIYELDLNGLTEINSLRFENRSIQNINKLENGYLIVDIMYEDGEG